MDDLTVNWLGCPVCDAEMQYWRDAENGVTIEEGVKCHNCGYTRQFAYGSHQIIVQGAVFEWSHCTPQEEIQQLAQDIRHDIEHARAALYSV